MGPHIINLVGPLLAKRLLLFGKSFSPLEFSILFDHIVHNDEELDSKVSQSVKEIQECGPEAISKMKQFIHTVYHERPEAQERMAKVVRDEGVVSKETQFGIRSLHKRIFPVDWSKL
jgi:enoyl-CoA hydratase/carnithine racemase